MVIKMRRLFTVLALLLLITNCFATQLTGKVVDAGTKQAIDFANVSVVKPLTSRTCLWSKEVQVMVFR